MEMKQHHIERETAIAHNNNARETRFHCKKLQNIKTKNLANSNVRINMEWMMLLLTKTQCKMYNEHRHLWCEHSYNHGIINWDTATSNTLFFISFLYRYTFYSTSPYPPIVQCCTTVITSEFWGAKFGTQHWGVGRAHLTDKALAR